MIRRRSLGPTTVFAAAALLMMPAAAAEQYKYSVRERIQLTRDLTAEYATAKVTLPRSKKPLPVDTSGNIDTERWTDAHQEYGPAARMGNLVQITKIQFESKKIIFEINGGFKGGRKWYQRIQIGMGGRGGTMSPVPRGQIGAQPAGTVLALMFPEGVPELEASKIKQLLKPILDFEKHSASEQYIDTLPEPVQAAIKENRAIEGMDRDAVLLSLGKPGHKVRETKDGVELEDWIYGTPPGKITFVTFHGNKVVKVKETYAGLGGSVAPTLPAQ